MYNFEKLEVWHLSRDLVKKVYSLLQEFPSEERYALCDQIRRAVISIPSNIAEGDSRISPKEQMHFIEIAYGSLMEVYCQLCIAVDLCYLREEQEELKVALQQINKVSKMLSGLRKSIKSKIP